MIQDGSVYEATGVHEKLLAYFLFEWQACKQ
jgi:hypothetical protein